MDDNGLVSPAKILDCNQFTWNWSTCAIHRETRMLVSRWGRLSPLLLEWGIPPSRLSFLKMTDGRLSDRRQFPPRKLLRTPRRPSLRSTFYLTCMPFLASTSNNFFNVCVRICEVCLTERETERQRDVCFEVCRSISWWMSECARVSQNV